MLKQSVQSLCKASPRTTQYQPLSLVWPGNCKFLSYGVVSGGGSWKVTAKADAFETFQRFQDKVLEAFEGLGTE